MQPEREIPAKQKQIQALRTAGSRVFFTQLLSRAVLPRAAGTAKRKPSHVHLPSRHQSRGRRRRGRGPAKSSHAARLLAVKSYGWFWLGRLCNTPRRADPGDRARVAGLCGRAPFRVGQSGGAGGRHAGPGPVPADVRSDPVRRPCRGHLRPAQDHDGGPWRAALHVSPVQRDGLWGAQGPLADLRDRRLVRLRAGPSIRRRARRWRRPWSSGG